MIFLFVYVIANKLQKLRCSSLQISYIGVGQISERRWVYMPKKFENW